MITNLQSVRVHLSHAIGHSLIQYRPDDKFIVAHPRSGSTWLRTVLANILRPDDPSNPDVFNKLIPGVSIRRMHLVNQLNSPRIIMSHTSYRPDLPKVLYLVRDGRDAIVSFFHFMIYRNNVGKPISFTDFFSSYYKGEYGYIWHQHIESWLIRGASELGDNLMVVRFEDLKAQTVRVVEDVTQFLDIHTTVDEIETAVKEARLSNVRKIEKQRWRDQGRGNPTDRSTFYRGGVTGQWRELFSESNYNDFLKNSSKALELAGYQLDS